MVFLSINLVVITSSPAFAAIIFKGEWKADPKDEVSFCPDSDKAGDVDFCSTTFKGKVNGNAEATLTAQVNENDEDSKAIAKRQFEREFECTARICPVLIFSILDYSLDLKKEESKPNVEKTVAQVVGKSFIVSKKDGMESCQIFFKPDKNENKNDKFQLVKKVEKPVADRLREPATCQLPIGDYIFKHQYEAAAKVSKGTDNLIASANVKKLQVNLISDPNKKERSYWDSIIELELVTLKGSETIEVIGPVFIDTFVGYVDDVDEDGLEEIISEIVSMELSGTGEIGDLKVQINNASNSPFQESIGFTEEIINAQSNRLDLPPFAPNGTAITSWEVFLEFEINGEVFHNLEPIKLEGVVTHEPPKAGEKYESFTEVELFDQDDLLTDIKINRISFIPLPIAKSVGGIDVEVNFTSLFLAGLSQVWMIPTVLGLAGAGVIIWAKTKNQFC